MSLNWIENWKQVFCTHSSLTKQTWAAQHSYTYIFQNMSASLSIFQNKNYELIWYLSTRLGGLIGRDVLNHAEPNLTAVMQKIGLEKRDVPGRNDSDDRPLESRPVSTTSSWLSMQTAS